MPARRLTHRSPGTLTCRSSAYGEGGKEHGNVGQSGSSRSAADVAIAARALHRGTCVGSGRSASIRGESATSIRRRSRVRYRRALRGRRVVPDRCSGVDFRADARVDAATHVGATLRRRDPRTTAARLVANAAEESAHFAVRDRATECQPDVAIARVGSARGRLNHADERRANGQEKGAPRITEARGRAFDLDDTARWIVARRVRRGLTPCPGGTGRERRQTESGDDHRVARARVIVELDRDGHRVCRRILGQSKDGEIPAVGERQRELRGWPAPFDGLDGPVREAFIVRAEPHHQALYRQERVARGRSSRHAMERGADESRCEERSRARLSLRGMPNLHDSRELRSPRSIDNGL